MEADSSKKEEAEFENVAAARSDQKDKEGHYSAELENSKQAISKTIKVKKGDQIKASVFATHDPAIAETDPTKAIAEAKKDVLLSLGGVVAGSINPTPIEQKIEIPLNPEISPAHTITIKSPKVQLNLLDFVPVIRNLRALNRAKKAKGLEPDTYFVPKGELVLELKDSLGNILEERREKLTISSAVSWEKLVSNLDISQDGNLSVYIDNASSDKVYFDEFIIERTEATVAVVVQENHYYPFGMNMKGIEELDLQSIDGNDEHRFQYNGKEKEESFGLYWNDHGARNLDVQLGRWNGVDKLADVYKESSPFIYTLNNPLKYKDLDGNVVRDKDGNIVFTSTGKTKSVEVSSTKTIKPDGSIAYVAIENIYTEGEIYADNGKPVNALSYSHLEQATYTWDTAKGELVRTAKKIEPSKNGDAKANCHGLTFANNKLWIDDEAVQTLLDNDNVYSTSEEGLANFVIFKNNLGVIIHSAIRNEEGTYDDNAGITETEYGRSIKEASRNSTGGSFKIANKSNNFTGNTFFYLRASSKVLNTTLGKEKDGIRTISDKKEIQQFLNLLKK